MKLVMTILVLLLSYELSLAQCASLEVKSYNDYCTMPSKNTNFYGKIKCFSGEKKSQIIELRTDASGNLNHHFKSQIGQSKSVYSVNKISVVNNGDHFSIQLSSAISRHNSIFGKNDSQFQVLDLENFESVKHYGFSTVIGDIAYYTRIKVSPLSKSALSSCH